MIRKLLYKFSSEELKILSGFLIDVAKGILGVPLVVYFLKDFSVVAMATVFVLDLMIVISLIGTSIHLNRLSRKKKDHE